MATGTYERRHICECCGITTSDIVSYGEPDSKGHLWNHIVCEACHTACTSDEVGNPVHISRVSACLASYFYEAEFDTLFQIVTLTDGRYAFVWGKYPGLADGASIYREALDDPTAERGAEIHDTLESAVESLMRTADAIEVVDPDSASEMRAAVLDSLQRN